MTTPHIVHEHAIYSVADAQQFLGLKASTVRGMAAHWRDSSKTTGTCQCR
jgi:hypothetical protein